MANYMLVEIWRPRPEWYALPRAQKEKFLAKAGEVIGIVEGKGAKITGLSRCRAGSEGGWEMVGFWEMPNYEIVVELAERIEKVGWNRYFEQINMVGTSITPEAYFNGLLEETDV